MINISGQWLLCPTNLQYYVNRETRPNWFKYGVKQNMNSTTTIICLFDYLFLPPNIMVV